jgi:hypothetical protein
MRPGVSSGAEGHPRQEGVHTGFEDESSARDANLLGIGIGGGRRARRTSRSGRSATLEVMEILRARSVG